MAGLRIGIHTSRSGSLEKTALRAYESGSNTFQIFSASPRMWRTVPFDSAEVLLFQKARERFDLRPLVIHASYLINLASLDPVIRSNSIEAFRGELKRAVELGAEFLVVHPGSYKSSSREEGIAAFASGLRDAARDVSMGGVSVLLENTVGAGAQLGGMFPDLRNIHDLAAEVCDVPIGFCLDTCHLWASGFDIATSVGLEDMVAAADRVLGMDRVKLIHTNDSKGALGSRLDRHANIGKGAIGLDGFGRIVRHSALRSKPFILETPEHEDGDQRRDIEMLKRLALAEGEQPKTVGKKSSKKKAKNAGKAV